MIEEEYKIEAKLESEQDITKEMEYYAQVYEIEHSLKDISQKADFTELSKILDSISKDLGIKSNLEKQLTHFLMVSPMTPHLYLAPTTISTLQTHPNPSKTSPNSMPTNHLSKHVNRPVPRPRVSPCTLTLV